MHVKEFYHFDLKDFTGYFEHERQVKYKLEDDPSCGITTGAGESKFIEIVIHNV